MTLFLPIAAPRITVIMTVMSLSTGILAAQNIAVQAITPVSNEKFGQAVELLYEKNRAIKSAEAAHQAAQRQVRAAGKLPDPMIEANFALQPVETRNGPIEQQIMLGQKIPLWGKLRRQSKIARAQEDIAWQHLQSQKVKAVYQLRSGWERYQRITRSLVILQDYLRELDSFRSNALARYATGSGLTQHPILKLQIEIALNESKINVLESEFASVTNDLQALFDGSFDTGMIAGVHISLPGNIAIEEWLSQSSDMNPALISARRRVNIARLEHEIVKRKNLPDLVAGVAYSRIGDTNLGGAPKPGADALGIKVGLNLPIWLGRNKARVQASRAMQRSREEIVEETWNQIENKVYSDFKALDEVGQSYTLYKDQLAPEADQMLASALSAYETGKISFLDLLDSQRMVIKIRLEFEILEARRRIVGARLLKNAGLVDLKKE